MLGRDGVNYEDYNMNPAISQGHLMDREQKGGCCLYERLKRGMDVVLSLLGLILLSPVFIGTAIAVLLEDGGPVIFVQNRTGLNGRTFRMYKFRSMVKNAPQMHKQLLCRNEMDGPAFKLHDAPRLTRVGRFIRRTSIDELPQLINIIKGDMSIVGPRPLPVYETEQMSDRDYERHGVKPGLTCYWQCSGRNNIDFDEWMELDRKYLEKRGIMTDLSIILRTFRAVLTWRGISKRHFYCVTKRGFDCICALTALVLLSPIMLLVSCLILAEDGGPVIYRQERVGQNRKRFRMYKFRSMYRDADSKLEQVKEGQGNQRLFFKDKNDPRITHIGALIRKYNIDELPQLINIIAGDMSIVGPRPLPVYEADAIGEQYRERYMVPQGLTCRWQISDRSRVSDRERMEMDVSYAKEAGWREDMTLILKTVITVARGQGEY